MSINEKIWDRLLKIKTSGRDASRADQHHFPYEPTPYTVLERLANSGLIRKDDVLVDYGVERAGRFFISYQTRAKTIGIEYDERIYGTALENQKTAMSANRVSFVLGKAEDYKLPVKLMLVIFLIHFQLIYLAR